mgnify:CR=1 FL=1
MDFLTKTTAFFLVLTLVPFSAFADNKLTVLLDWFVNPDHAPLVVALQSNRFKEAGLNVELIAPSDPNLPPKLVAAGKGDIAVSYQPQLHIQADQGLPLVRIGTLISTPLNSLVVLRDGKIKSIADLKGKKIGFSVGGFEDALLKTMLNSHNVKLSEVQLINVNFALSPSLISEKVDAVIGAFRNFELNQMDIVKRPGHAFYPEEHGVPPYDELILVSHKNSLSDPKLRKFLNVLEAATLFLINHPKKSWDLFTSFDNKLDDELNRRAWRDTLARFALRPAALDTARYKRFASFLRKQNLIRKTPAIDDYAVQVMGLH